MTYTYVVNTRGSTGCRVPLSWAQDTGRGLTSGSSTPGGKSWVWICCISCHIGRYLRADTSLMVSGPRASASSWVGSTSSQMLWLWSPGRSQSCCQPTGDGGPGSQDPGLGTQGVPELELACWWARLESGVQVSWGWCVGHVLRRQAMGLWS